MGDTPRVLLDIAIKLKLLTTPIFDAVPVEVVAIHLDQHMASMGLGRAVKPAPVG